jgi:hypothetical protein
MATMTADRLVEDYLQRLEAAAHHLPADRRAELVIEIREHIDHALSETGTDDELAVRNALERLGPPEEIVAAAEPPPPAEPRRAARGWLEIAALVALLIPFAGWLVGLVLVALSRVWSNREKALGLALILAAILLPALTFVGASAEGEPVPIEDPTSREGPGADTGGPGEFVAVAVMLLGGLPAAVFLGWRLSVRRSTV